MSCQAQKRAEDIAETKPHEYIITEDAVNMLQLSFAEFKDVRNPFWMSVRDVKLLGIELATVIKPPRWAEVVMSVLSSTDSCEVDSREAVFCDVLFV